MPGTHTGGLQPHIVGSLLVARLEQVCPAHKEGPGTPCSQGEGTQGAPTIRRPLLGCDVVPRALVRGLPAL